MNPITLGQIYKLPAKDANVEVRKVQPSLMDNAFEYHNANSHESNPNLFRERQIARGMKIKQQE